MDDLGLSADIVGASSIFTGDEEVFAFARALVSSSSSWSFVLTKADSTSLRFVVSSIGNVLGTVDECTSHCDESGWFRQHIESDGQSS